MSDDFSQALGMMGGDEAARQRQLDELEKCQCCGKRLRPLEAMLIGEGRQETMLLFGYCRRCKAMRMTAIAGLGATLRQLEKNPPMLDN